ncbi:MAG: S1C family serine protease, partial [Bacteroidota bacterium]
MRKLFLALSVLVVLSLLGGCAAAPNAVSAVANLARGAAPVAQAQATPVAPSTQGTDQTGTTTTQQAAPVVQNVPAGILDIQNTLSNLYDAVSPSVVNINVTMSATPGQNALPDMGQLPNLPGSPFGGQGDQGGFQSEALGSGFVWDNQGNIITNNHVVDGATRISVTFSDGLTLPATLVGRDPESEVAVIHVDPTKVNNLHPVNVGDSTKVKPGQFVVAIGNPYGLEGTMTFGIVSALGRSLPVGNTFTNAGSYTIPDIIQTDAPVNPGNSGGVLVDMNGRLVGIPTAIESQSGASAGIGFAVPSVIVQKVAPELIRTGKFEHPYIGIRGGTLTSQVAEAMKLPATTRGALVVEVTPGSPAEKAG